MFIKDQLELEIKPEDCVATKNTIRFLFPSCLKNLLSLKDLPDLDTKSKYLP